MKKLLILSLIIPVYATAQTIPNGNFENWIMVGMYENPEFWVTDNTEIGQTVTKDYDSYEGEIAMRVTALPTGLGEYGEATTIFDLNYFASSLNFYAKYSTDAGVVSVEIRFFDANEDEIFSENWLSSESSEDYTLVSIPFTPYTTPEDPPPAYARILVSAMVGDLAPGHAWISVDAMEMGVPQGLSELRQSTFKIFPNPASEYLSVQSSQEIIGNLKIFDAQGKRVFEKRILATSTEIDVRKFSPGIYTLQSDNLKFKASTFVVTK